jgi:hypothetical protein
VEQSVLRRNTEIDLAILSLAIAVLYLASGALPARAQSAYTLLESTDLVIMDLESGTIANVGSTGLLILAIARSPLGDLYAAVASPGIPANPWELWKLDPASGTPTFVGQLYEGLTPVGDLSFDADGRLWLTAGGQLHEVDLGTGMASPVGLPGGALEGLASLGSDLYGIEETAPLRWRLVAVDKMTGAATPIVPLSALDDIPEPVMDFDSDGRLWILDAGFPSSLFRLDELTSGQLEAVPLGDPGNYGGIAILGPLPPIVVPTLNHLGFLVLALSLVSVALDAIHRRLRELRIGSQ